MDPNETLRRIRMYTAQPVLLDDDGICLAELVTALDDWLTRGGFLPDGWRATLASTRPCP